jgi:septum formation protein
MKLLLASASPRRKEILGMLGIDFEIVPADIDESIIQDENPRDYVHRLSIEKALKVSKTSKDCIVIGSDLTIDLDGESIAKAETRLEATDFLQKLSGRTHQTHCGFAITQDNRILSSGVASTFMTFKKLTDSQIASYVESNEWVGLAGAYGVQGGAAKFVEKFEGSYFDILGLPIYEIVGNLFKFNLSIIPEHIQNLINFDLQKRHELNSNS